MDDQISTAKPSTSPDQRRAPGGIDREHAFAAGSPPAAREEAPALDYELIELFFFAYRDFTSDPDVILEKRGFGRAHHRVLHFVDREPGMTVADLLETLRITKQSLARVLKQLIDGGYVHQVAGPEDRRQRKLYTTREGKALARALAEPQSRRIADALAKVGPEGRDVIRHFLASMKTGSS